MFSQQHIFRVLPTTKKATPEISAKTFDPENIIPITVIRQHTKTEDVPHVTDEQLAMYRMASIEAAEQYTGLLLLGQKVVSEPLKTPNALRSLARKKIRQQLDFPVADGIVYLYGSSDGTGDRVIQVAPGASEITIPTYSCDIDLSPCCSPCGDGGTGMFLMYRAGYRDEDSIPSGIILGCLKYIAWSISNPGDIIMTVRNAERTSLSGIVGTNNAAWASGAIEQWRIYVRDAY